MSITILRQQQSVPPRRENPGCACVDLLKLAIFVNDIVFVMVIIDEKALITIHSETGRRPAS